MDKYQVPGVVQAFLIAVSIVILNFAIEFFSGTQGNSYEYASFIVFSATALLRIIQVKKTEVAANMKRAFQPSQARSTLKRILIGD